jgi:hypothetical protein
MRIKVNVMDAQKRPYEGKNGKGIAHTLIVSEAPGRERLNGELQFTLNDEDAGRIDVLTLAGKSLDLVIKDLSVGYGGKLFAKGYIPEAGKEK